MTAKILVVDDETGIRFFLKDALAQEGHHVVTVDSGEAALERIATETFDLAIVDLKMKGVGGLEVLAALRQQSPDTPAIVLTAYASLETAVEAIRQGAHDYLFKPCTMTELQESVRTGLLERRRKLGEHSRAKFISDASHELRAPIANIMLDLDLLERSMPAECTNHMDVLKQETDRMTDLVENILTLSRLEADEIEMEFTPQDFNALVEPIAAAHRPRAVAANLELIFEPDEALPPMHVEPNQLSQVVTNLVTNAINYTPAGQVRVSTHLDAERGRACLQVQDTGMGIAPEDMPRLFERFYRGWRATNSTVSGTGLGLAIVKEIVDLHGGEIEVESQVDEGSTFKVWLPLERANGQQNRRLRPVRETTDSIQHPPGGNRFTEADRDTLQSTFIRNVSHELRTPLSIIQGYAELLGDGDLSVPERQQAAIVITRRAGELRTMVKRIDTLMAIEAHKGISSPLALDKIIAEAVQERRPAAAAAGLALEARLEPDLALVAGDLYHLRQAIDCLLENALKFTPNGGRVEVRAYATPPAPPYEEGSTKAGWVCLEVNDSGVGIPEQELERIFADFYQIDGSTTRQYGGIGLGLTVARAVIEEHGGRIEVESQAGQGSRFTIKLPALPPDAQVSQPAERSVELQRILVVDDEENVALIIQDNLESLPNYEISIATSSEQALRLFEQQPFDLLITDYMMPGADGITLATRVRQTYPQTAIIMITAYSDDALREQAARASIQHILDKPVGLAEIHRVVSETLADGQTSSQARG
ncbi:MAG: ATP-binding protein [Chloroflexota bacterium]|nr:ATP-binding protein [Chloroflexota bacterium]